jgi:cell division protein FtsW (lipid II flippase)
MTTMSPVRKMGRLKHPSGQHVLRNRELGLLLFAMTITLAALAIVQFAVLGQLEPGMLTLVMGVMSLIVVFHVVLRFTAPQADAIMVPVAALLNGLGIVEIYRIDLADKVEGWDALSVKQCAWTALALVVSTVAILLVRQHRVLQRYTYTSGLVAVVLLLLPVLPGIGIEVNGARVWIQIAGLTFQPGEVAKIALAIFFAGYLVQHRESLSMVGRQVFGMRLPRGRDLGPIVAVWVLSMSVIVFQRDLGTGLLYFGLFLVMLYAATGRASWVGLGVGLFVAGAVAANFVLGYVNDRFANWYDAFNEDRYNEIGGSYQLVQGLFGLAHGGVIGTGLGQGLPYITPVSQSDYIVASLGEELGLAGLFAILCLYMILTTRGLRIGYIASDEFSKLLATGLAFVIALQCFIVIGGVTRVIPLTGLTTPFLAAGGSSLVANWIIIALLLRLSDAARSRTRLVVA